MSAPSSWRWAEGRGAGTRRPLRWLLGQRSPTSTREVTLMARLVPVSPALAVGAPPATPPAGGRAGRGGPASRGASPPPLAPPPPGPPRGGRAALDTLRACCLAWLL